MILRKERKMLKKLFLAISAFTITTAANLSFAPEAQALGKGLTGSVPPVAEVEADTSNSYRGYRRYRRYRGYRRYRRWRRW
jgi:hypothetical protein